MCLNLLALLEKNEFLFWRPKHILEETARNFFGLLGERVPVIKRLFQRF